MRQVAAALPSTATAAVITALCAACASSHATDTGVPSEAVAARSTFTAGEATGKPNTPTSDSDVVDSVAATIAKLGARRGFAQASVDAAHLVVSVRWAGPVPDDIARYASTRPNGVTVRIAPTARYTLQDGNAARDRIIADPWVRTLNLVAVDVTPDGLLLGLNRTEHLAPTDLARLRAIAEIPDINLKYGLSRGRTY